MYVYTMQPLQFKRKKKGKRMNRITLHSPECRV